MLFNLNEFLLAVSFTLDFVEMDILGVTSNHGKRTAYISLNIAKELGLNSEELHDIVALAIMHDNGVSEKSLQDKLLNDDEVSLKGIERIKEHCTIGEENIAEYPFLTNVENVIKYHHEKYDGTGFFHVIGEDIPIMAQIIHLADVIEIGFDLENSNPEIINKILRFVEEEKNKMFSPQLVTVFFEVAKRKDFWDKIKKENIGEALKSNTPNYSLELSMEKIRILTGVFSKIIDAKSKFTQRHSKDLSKKAAIMADYYKMQENEKMKLIIAANLHDIGKLAVPNDILDSPNQLSSDEFEIIKKHPYYTRIALQEIKGFEDITEWASNHHEKLNGNGYPFGKRGEEIDFNSRLMGCLDVYEALTEERPYRTSLNHEEAMEIIDSMKNNGFLDSKIVSDIDYVFNQDFAKK